MLTSGGGGRGWGWTEAGGQLAFHFSLFIPFEFFQNIKKVKKKNVKRILSENIYTVLYGLYFLAGESVCGL